jgi:hypothetical protein
MKNVGSSTEKPRGPIFCSHDERWKEELERRFIREEKVTLLAIGEVKEELLRYLNKRKDLQIIKLETRYMKRREKGLGLKITVKKLSSGEEKRIEQ